MGKMNSKATLNVECINWLSPGICKELVEPGFVMEMNWLARDM